MHTLRRLIAPCDASETMKEIELNNSYVIDIFNNVLLCYLVMMPPLDMVFVAVVRLFHIFYVAQTIYLFLLPCHSTTTPRTFINCARK
jgi:hypothetical protein